MTFILVRITAYKVEVSVGNRSGYPASGPGWDRKNSWVPSQTCPKTRPAASWQAKPVPVPVNVLVLLGSARPVGSNQQFSFSGCSIYGCSQICYCYLQNINFGTSFSLLVSLAAFIIKTSRDRLPATS